MTATALPATLFNLPRSDPLDGGKEYEGGAVQVNPRLTTFGNRETERERGRDRDRQTDRQKIKRFRGYTEASGFPPGTCGRAWYQRLHVHYDEPLS